MNLRRKIISLILIFAYSIGFAHELIPHIHLNDTIQRYSTVSNIDFHLVNHQHVTTENKNHIAHSDHMDDSLYGYLACLMSCAEHTSSHSSYEESSISIVSDTQHSSNKNLISVCAASSFYDVEFTASKLNFFDNDEVNYLPPLTKSTHKRGPPTFSC